MKSFNVQTLPKKLGSVVREAKTVRLVDNGKVLATIKPKRKPRRRKRMILHEYRIDSARLKALPIEQRQLIFQIGHILNELNYFDIQIRVLIKATKKTTKLLGAASNAHKITLLCLLAGRMQESWEVLRKGYFATKLSLTIDPKLPSDATDALKRLKRYFGQGNSLTTQIRNQFGFHHDLSAIEKQVKSFESIDSQVYYRHNRTHNMFFDFAFQGVTFALFDLTNEATPRKALDRIYNEIYISTFADFTLFFHSLLAHLLRPISSYQAPITIGGKFRLSELQPYPFLGTR